MTESHIAYVIDDDEAVRHSLATLISVLGHGTESYESAEQFLEDFCPDWTGVLFVDLRLPGISGRELIEKITAAGTKLKIVLMTGHAASDSLVWTDAHSVLVLEKPFAVTQLKELFSR